VDSILPVDECWLVDPRELARRADPSGTLRYDRAYARAVDELAARGMGCVPDPAAGDAHPQDVVATCIVYRAPGAGGPLRSSCEHQELHLRLVCAMARTDGAFVGSELAVALELADRVADGDEPRRMRFRALVRELFISPAAMPDPVAQLTELPRERALEVVEHLKAVAWADGCLRSAEQRMLCRVHDLLGLPQDLVGALATTTRFVDPLAA
jgi:uncharacterized tellurite resistance protein B-like protein